MDIKHQLEEIKVIVKGNGNGNKQPLYYYESKEVINKVALILTELMKKNIVSGEMASKVNQSVIKTFTDNVLEKDCFIVVDDTALQKLLIKPDSDIQPEERK